MEKKVLIIDDSALMRRVISDIINSGIEKIEQMFYYINRTNVPCAEKGE